MPNDDDYVYQNNTMQMAAGLFPPFTAMPPPTPFPGQVSSAIRAGVIGGLPGFQQQIPTFTNTSPFMPGPGGVLMPMHAAAPFNPFAQAGGGGYGVPPPWPGLYSSPGAMPPPAYAGLQGRNPTIMPGASVAPQMGSFANPYEYEMAQRNASMDRGYAMQNAGLAAVGRMGTNVAAGVAGMALGGPFGFGGGVIASELTGLGRAGQNAFMRAVAAPILNMQGYGAGIQDLSRSFVAGGPQSDAMGGLSRAHSLGLGRGLEDMSNSRDFRRETFNRFNTADVMRITQVGAENGLMAGAQNTDQIKRRVREIASSVSMFMELSNEPDLRRAMQAMGSLQMQGLTMGETIGAVRNGRAFARMAGTTFESLAATAGSNGAQTFQAMGLTQGLGLQTGMMHGGMAQMAHNAGIVGPQLMNLVGGPQGLANLNTMFSAGQLQLPMMAPGMMTGNGGLNASALQGLMGGRMTSFGMTGMGANNLSAMTGRMGPEGLGMALSMQPMLQDQIGRILQARSPFAQRNMEDSLMLGDMRYMGMRGTSGFITAARMHGMDSNQALARAQELGSGVYFDQQRNQIETRRSERASEEIRDRENRANVSVMDQMTSGSTLFARGRRWLGRLGTQARNAFEDMSVGPRTFSLALGSAASVREREEYTRSADSAHDYRAAEAAALQRGDVETRGFLDRRRADSRIADANGGSGVASFLSSLLPRSADSRRMEELAISQRSDIAQAALNSGPMSDRDRDRTTRTFFGSAEARRDFAMEALSISGRGAGRFGGAGGQAAINTGFRAAVSRYTWGVLDPGNITSRGGFDLQAMRDAYIRNAVRGGVSHDAATRYADNNLSSMVGAAGEDIRFFGTREQIAGFESALGGASGGRTRGGDVAAEGRRTQETGLREIYGEDFAGDRNHAQGHRQRTAVSRLLDAQGEGLGSNRAQREQSRAAMAAMTALGSMMRGNNYSSSEREGAGRRMRELASELTRRGFSDSQVNAMMRQAQTRERTLGGDAEIQGIGERAARHSGREILQSFTHGSQQIVSGEATERTAQGIDSLSRLGGPIGDIFRGTNGRRASVSEIQQHLVDAAADPGRMAQLDRAGFGNLARRAARGELTDAEIQRGAGNYGRVRAQRAEAAADNVGIGRRILRRFGIGDSREQTIQNEMNSGTGADQAAASAFQNTQETQDTARQAGIGGPMDQFTRATNELLQAARILRGVGENGDLDNLTNGNPGAT